MWRSKACAVPAAVLLLVALGAGMSGCLGDDETVAVEASGYVIYYDADVMAYDGATAEVHVEYLAADGGTESDSPTDFPWQGADSGYASGDTLWLRVHGTAVCANARGGVVRSLRIWGSSPYDVPVDFGTDVFERVVGEFDDVKTVILP